MTDTNNSKDLAVGLEVFPRVRRISTENKLKTKTSRVPRLMGEGGFLMLGVERTYGGKWNQLMTEKHGQVVPQ